MTTPHSPPLLNFSEDVPRTVNLSDIDNLKIQKFNIMTNFNEIALVVATPFNNGNVDKNGLEPMLLKCIAGKSVNRSILSGTIAEREGFESHKSYLVSITEREIDETYGRQFSFTNLGEMKGIDLIKASKELGKALIINVMEEELVEETTNTEASQPVGIPGQF